MTKPVKISEKLRRLQNRQREIILRTKLALELKNLRKQYNITQKEFAEYLKCSVVRVKTYEQPKCLVTSTKLRFVIEKLKRMNDDTN